MKRISIISGIALIAALVPYSVQAQFRTPPNNPIGPGTPSVIAPNPNLPLDPGNPSILAPNANLPINPFNPTGNTAFANGSASTRLAADQAAGANISLGGAPFLSFSALGGFPIGLAMSGFPSGIGVAGFPSGIAPSGFPWFAGGYGSYGGYGGGGISTGNLAQVIRQSGEAAVLYERARDHYIDNAVRSNLLWFEMRDANDAYRLKQRNKYRHSNETLARAAMDALPQRLAADDLDTITGRINWPSALLGDQFSDYRNQLEEQFAMRASSGQPSDTTARIQNVVRGMEDALRLNIDNIPADDYMAARKFLESLYLTTHHREF